MLSAETTPSKQKETIFGGASGLGGWGGGVDSENKEEEREKVGGTRASQGSGVSFPGTSLCELPNSSSACPGQERPHLAAPCAAPGFPLVGNRGHGAASTAPPRSAAPPGRLSHFANSIPHFEQTAPLGPNRDVESRHRTPPQLRGESPRRRRGSAETRGGALPQ